MYSSIYNDLPSVRLSCRLNSKFTTIEGFWVQFLQKSKLKNSSLTFCGRTLYSLLGHQPFFQNSDACKGQSRTCSLQRWLLAFLSKPSHTQALALVQHNNFNIYFYYYDLFFEYYHYTIIIIIVIIIVIVIIFIFVITTFKGDSDAESSPTPPSHARAYTLSSLKPGMLGSWSSLQTT
jgi:hypothetical protein